MAIRISDDLFLIERGIDAVSSKRVEVPTNHIVVVDCSGSMHYELPKIREQLKRKLPKLIGEFDTFSIVWFSGRGEFGTLLEAEQVATLSDLSDVNKAIDRWLKPVGLTGFKDPLIEVSSLIERISKKNDGIFNLFFMSDGCDNCSTRNDILKAVEAMAGKVCSATFVEYGYYADRNLLSTMAEKAGGQLIFAENFDKYVPQFEDIIGRKLSGAPRISIEIPGDVIGGFVFSLSGGDITTYSVNDGVAVVPSDASSIWWLAPKSNGNTKFYSVKDMEPSDRTTTPGDFNSALYAAVSLFSVRMKPEIVLPVLKFLGDVSFIEEFSTCFGKQRYSDFMDRARLTVFNEKFRYLNGYDPSKVPDDDAYTVLDLLRLLSDDDSSRVLLDHPEFRYSKIGRGRVDADELLTEEEQEKVSEICARIASEKNAKKLKDLQSELDAITSSKKDALKFIPTPSNDGYSISNLTYNEDRPNISILFRKEGTVDLSSRLPAEHDKVPTIFPSFIFRNYAIIKDGLVNVEKLPVRVSKETAAKLSSLLPDGAKPTHIKVVGDYVEGVLDLRYLPVINRRMIKAASARALFEKQFALETARAAAKVYKAYQDERIVKKESASFKTSYGEAAANWLKEQGFTDYSGFNPKSLQAESTDFYMGKELVVSIKGLSSLPKVSDVKTRIASGKMTTASSMMAPFVTEVENWLQSPEYLEASNQDEAFKSWIGKKAKDAIVLSRKYIYEIACIKFSIIIGQIWFTEFSTLDENSLTMDFGDLKGIVCSVKMNEVEIKI